MAKITTKTGDGGTTGLLGPERVSKDDMRIEALGALDEAQSALGLARAFADPVAAESLLQVQRELYRVMGEISTSGQPDGESIARTHQLWTTADHVAGLERDIERWREGLSPEFIIPGSSPFDGALHLGRALVRRAERRLVTLQRNNLLANPETLRYVNRLSDWVYTFGQQLSTQPAVKAKGESPAGESERNREHFLR